MLIPMGHSSTALLEDSPSVEVALTPGSKRTVLSLSLHLHRAGGRVNAKGKDQIVLKR